MESASNRWPNVLPGSSSTDSRSTHCLGEPSQAVTAVSEPLDRFFTMLHSLRLYGIFINGIERDLLV